MAGLPTHAIKSMEQSDINTEKPKKKSLKAWAWVFGVYFLIMAVVCFVGIKILSGILFIIGGLFLLPPVIVFIKKRWGYRFSREMRVGIALVTGFAACAAYGGTASIPTSASSTPSTTPVTVVPSSATTTIATTTLTKAQTLQANDELYISSFNNYILPDFAGAGSELQAAGSDLQNYDFTAALADFQSTQSDFEKAQTDLQTYYQLNAPYTPDIEHINSVATMAITDGITGSNDALTELKNGDNDDMENIAMPEFANALNYATQAKELIAGFQSNQT